VGGLFSIAFFLPLNDCGKCQNSLFFKLYIKGLFKEEKKNWKNEEGFNYLWN
jgi:hypothetical protein